jgi:hypothetical protein
MHACEEGGDGVMGVLVSGVAWERKFGDCGLHVVTCGGTSGETCIDHGGITKIAKLQMQGIKLDTHSKLVLLFYEC